MESAARRDSIATWALVMLAAACAVVASVRASSLYGLGIDGDAAWTLSAGASLARGHGLVTCLDEVFSLWPPLYPCVMAGIDWLGLDVLSSLRLLHLVALASTVVLGARLAWEVSRSQVAAAATAGSLALTYRLHEYTIQVVSETLFLPLVLGALLVACSLERSFTTRKFVALAALSALACLQRYLGVTLVGAVALYASWSPRWGSPLQRVRRAAVYAAVSLAPLGAWFLRNRSVESSWTGGRDATEVTLADALAAALATLRSWAAPVHADGLAWVVLGAVVLLVVALALHRTESRAALTLLVTFCAVYFVALVGMASTVVLDGIGDRLMLPLLVPLVTLAWSGALAAWRVPLWVAGLLIALAWLDAAPKTSEKVAAWTEQGAGGFHTRVWQEHAVTRALRQSELAAPCWSNGPELVWLEKRISVRFLRGGAKAWERAAVEAGKSGGSLAWFQDGGRPPAFPDVLQAHVRAEPLAEVRDGLLLRLAPR